MRTVFSIFSLLFLFAAGCKEEGFQTHDSGLKYRFIETNENAPKPKQNDVLELTVIISQKNGQVLYDTREIPGPFRQKLKQPAHEGGSITDAYALMHEGDSLHCYIRAGDFYRYSRKQPLPEKVSKSEDLLFRIKLHKIYSPDEFSKIRQKRKQRLREEEQSYLKEYLMENEITQSPRPSGLYFISQRKGKGKSPQPGDSVKVHYRGYLLSGNQFDSSYKRGEPLAFQMGANRVIPGWEEGLALMHKGGKAKLIIPSHLAYGEKGYGDMIPPYSTLIFEIELLDVY